MKALLFLLMIGSVMGGYHPTIDGATTTSEHRWEYEQDTLPYMLGISIPPDDSGRREYIKIMQADEVLLDGYFRPGTLRLGYITDTAPVKFYSFFTPGHSRYEGQITHAVPEPLTLALLTGGALLIRRKK